MIDTDLYTYTIEDEMMAAGHYDLVDRYRSVAQLHKQVYAPFALKAKIVSTILKTHAQRMQKTGVGITDTFRDFQSRLAKALGEA